MWYMLFWKEDVFSKHRHNEAFVLHLSTGEEEVVLGGLQHFSSESFLKAFFFFLFYENSFHDGGGQSRLLPHIEVAENFAYSFQR